MKKLFKAMLLIAVVACCAVAMAFAGCGKKDNGQTVTGEYKYVNTHYQGEGTQYYGIKVKVTVKEDNVISKVKVVDSDYVSVTDIWENKATWNDGLSDLLKKYEGKNAIDVLKVPVQRETNGQPSNGQALGGYLTTGATQGSGRLLLAVQNALSKAELTITGEYKYVNTYYQGEGTQYYGVKVNVTFTAGDGKILKVKIVDSDYVSVTDTWENKATWNDGLNDLLKKYEGKTATEIMNIDVSKEASGQPSNGQALGGMLITGATQGSGRLLLAVQNAFNEAFGS